MIEPLQPVDSPPLSLRETIRENAYLIFALVGMMWLVEIVDVFTPQSSLDRFGILTRQASGLPGIILAPFLHGGFQHLLGNSIPFIVLSALVILSGRLIYLEVFFVTAMTAGIGTWLLAPPNSLHIGASGVVFGLLGFLIFRAWFGRRIGWIVVAIVAALLYGGLIFTLFRHQEGISWHGHFFGFAGGFLSAKWHVSGIVKENAGSSLETPKP
ncbi:MAG: rhomboid family intramembrane serine protease [Verrucomicrobiota bacterium]